MTTISVVVPTYRREHVLIETLRQLSMQMVQGDELIVVDQTERHDASVEERLQQLEDVQAIRRIRQQIPSVTAAMNRGLLEARCDVVLFVDDDIVPGVSLVAGHREAHEQYSKVVVAGRVLQPWDVPDTSTTRPTSVFAGVEAAWLDEFMGGNFSVRRDDALDVRGFDENFVQVAYRYEAEFASRFRAAGGRIRFEPTACLLHLRAASGGTRSYGEHLTTMNPAHAVGAYYYSIRTQSHRHWLRECVTRPFRAVATRHHLKRPWWIPFTLCAELRGIVWAMRLNGAGPRLIETTKHVS